jgi:hypothetical protein
VHDCRYNIQPPRGDDPNERHPIMLFELQSTMLGSWQNQNLMRGPVWLWVYQSRRLINNVLYIQFICNYNKNGILFLSICFDFNFLLLFIQANKWSYQINKKENIMSKSFQGKRGYHYKGARWGWLGHPQTGQMWVAWPPRGPQNFYFFFFLYFWKNNF